MKKVLYIASTYGHILSFHIPYIRELEAMGFEVHVAGGGAVDTYGIEEFRKPVGASELEHLHLINVPFQKRMFSPKNIRCVMQLRQLMKEEHYNLISVHTSLAAFFVRLSVMLTKNIRPYVINTVHGYLFDKNTNFIKKSFMIMAEKLVKKATDEVIVMNNEDYEIAKKYKLYKHKLRKIPGYGINAQKYNREAAELELRGLPGMEDVPPDEFALWCRNYAGVHAVDAILFCAAEFSKRKNQKMLIEAMKCLPPTFSLILAGDGACFDKCWKQAKESGRIRFVGRTSDLNRYYYPADIYVSASRIEGLPFSVMEAMSMGLPVVATDIKGHRDLIEDGVNGYLYKYNDIKSFCDAVVKIIYKKTIDPKANIEKAQKYSVESVFDTVMEVYRDFLK